MTSTNNDYKLLRKAERKSQINPIRTIWYLAASDQLRIKSIYIRRARESTENDGNNWRRPWIHETLVISMKSNENNVTKNAHAKAIKIEIINLLFSHMENGNIRQWLEQHQQMGINSDYTFVHNGQSVNKQPSEEKSGPIWQSHCGWIFSFYEIHPQWLDTHLGSKFVGTPTKGSRLDCILVWNTTAKNKNFIRNQIGLLAGSLMRWPVDPLIRWPVRSGVFPYGQAHNSTKYMSRNISASIRHKHQYQHHHQQQQSFTWMLLLYSCTWFSRISLTNKQ